MDQAGGEYNLYKGAVYQRGYGLGGAFRKFFSWIMPIVKKHALPALESGAKVLGKEAVSAVGEIAKDVLAGKNLKNSVHERGSMAIDNIKDYAEKSLEGRGIKKRKSKKKFIIIKKKPKHTTDIFD